MFPYRFSKNSEDLNLKILQPTWTRRLDSGLSCLANIIFQRMHAKEAETLIFYFFCFLLLLSSFSFLAGPFIITEPTLKSEES